MVISTQLRPLILLLATLLLVACGGGGGGSGGGPNSPPVDGGGGSAPPPPPTEPPPVFTPLVFDEMDAARFLNQATFGANAQGIEQVLAAGPEAWLVEQLNQPATLHLEDVLAGFPADGSFFDERGNTLPELLALPSASFWEKAIEADDQLRQRMAFALSQILVVSYDSILGRAPQAVAHYMDILTAGALGNYRALLEDVTYSPAMALYLTYLRNEKADPEVNRVPDENYAREILQLFTLGLVELQPDGTPVIGPDGEEVELYTNEDITELAKVFTGLSFDNAGFNAPLPRVPLPSFYSPLRMFDAYHSTESKRFLGAVIPEDTAGDDSIAQALDIIFAHPNLGPFLGRQLIQRFVTSAPTPDYVSRVAAAFDNGAYSLPDGSEVGTGLRGDLAATIAAVLFDAEARDASAMQEPTFGKLREPVLRFTHWSRAFNINSADTSNEPALRFTGSPETLGQQPYGAPSVFNFYRPGYIAAGTATGDAGLTAPELQITNASTLIGYANFMTTYTFSASPKFDLNRPAAFEPDYAAHTSIADDTDALLDSLDPILTHGGLADATREGIAEVIDQIGGESLENRELRTQLAIIMIMTSPEYIVLR